MQLRPGQAQQRQGAFNSCNDTMLRILYRFCKLTGDSGGSEESGDYGQSGDSGKYGKFGDLKNLANMSSW